MDKNKDESGFFRHGFVVTRPWEKGTGAYIAFKSPREEHSLIDARDGIKRAVTEWIRKTYEGKRAWEESSLDFNIGDLIGYTKTPTLAALLTLEDIHDLEILSASHVMSVGDWDFDTILCDHTALDEEDVLGRRREIPAETAAPDPRNEPGYGQDEDPDQDILDGHKEPDEPASSR